MPSDATTFFLSFAAVLLGIAYYLWHLERTARRLEDRIAALEAARPGDTNVKNPGATGSDQP